MASRDAVRPNIVLVLADDQGHWALGSAGNDELRTPHLDALARGGARFSNFFCVSPVCSPARASLLTGRIPSQHGLHDWLRGGNSPEEPARPGVVIEYLAGQIGTTDILAREGWVCGISGKWHLGDSLHPQKGFSFWEVHAIGGAAYYGAPMVHDGAIYREPRYVTDAITDNALRFLDERAEEERPFYLSLHYTAPHSPWEREQHPADIYDSYFRDCPFDSIPREPMHPWQANTAPYGYDENSRRAILSGYFAAITAMDANVGRVMARIDALGLAGNTLVIFTSDNGMNMGHHGIYGKGNGTFPLNMYDTSVKVPMVISRPGHVPAGRTCDAMLSHYDVMPTLLDYLGIEGEAPDGLPGRSFAPLLRGKPLCGRPFDGRDEVVVYDEYGPVRMIRTREWKYVHRYPYGPHELYDLVNDPDERRDLVGEPDRQEVIVEMRRRLEEWFFRYVDPAVDGAREPVTGRGQIGLAGVRACGTQSYAQDWKHLTPTPA